MDNQYYTPEISDLLYGMEIEIHREVDIEDERYPENEWKKIIFPTTWIDEGKDAYAEADFNIHFNWLRVRCLNREDIESLGFSLFGKGDKTFHIKTNTVYMILLSGDKTFITKDVFLPDKSTANTTVFEGTIKNRSELSCIMKQVGMI